MRALLVFVLLVSTTGAVPTADEYFELGLDYLKKGFFGRARAAFSESLVIAPNQPVPLAFLGVAAAAEGRTPALCARLLRMSQARLPKGKALRLDLAKLLPSRRTLELLQDDYERALGRRGADRRPLLTVLAFLQVHDGDSADAPALDALLKDAPKDPYARALHQLRPLASNV